MSGATAYLSAFRTNASAAFSYYSGVFGGSAYVARGSNLTGISDGSLGLLSVWVKATDNFSSIRFLFEDSGYLDISRNTSNILTVVGYSPGAVVVLSLASTVQIDNDGLWHHLLLSWDLGTAGRSYIYIDGVDRTTRTTHTVGGTINLTAGGWGVMANSAGSGIGNAKLSELYFTAPAAWFDVTNSANRDKFFNSSTSKPVDLGANGSTPTGTQPLIYFHNQSPSWGTNLGSGGTFTTTGSVTDGGSDKP